MKGKSKSELAEVAFVRDPIDTNGIQYKDRARERQRKVCRWSARVSIVTICP
jgi:hypothetical protein